MHRNPQLIHIQNKPFPIDSLPERLSIAGSKKKIHCGKIKSFKISCMSGKKCYFVFILKNFDPTCYK
jgi:hypothetical protein